jgi:hypothetical protein
MTPYRQYRARVTCYCPSGGRTAASYRVDAENPAAARKVALRRLQSDRRRNPLRISAVDLFELKD